MADQQDRPLVLDQQALEQLQRLDVEVVGRLVEDQHVRRPGEQLRQQEPAPLAAGEELDQAPRPLGREEEVLQVAEDVPGLAVDRDRVVLADVLLDRLLLVERRPSTGRSRRPPGWSRGGPSPRCGGSWPSRSRSRVVLPEPLGPMMPDLVAAHDRRRQVADDRPVAVAEADPLGLDDQGARPLGLLHLHPRRALPLAPLLAGLAHRLQGPDPALVAGPAGLDPLADPDLLLGQLLVEEGVLPRLGRQQLLLALRGRSGSRRPSRRAGRGRARRSGWPAARGRPGRG